MDQWAYRNRFAKIHPLEKFIAAMGAMIFLLLWDKPMFQGIIFLTMTGMTVLGAKIPLRIYLKYLSIPFVFIIMTLLPILFGMYADSGQLLWSFPFANRWIGITYEGMSTAIGLFFRTMAALSCLYFLALTTSMQDIIYLLEKLRFPSVFTELMVLTYRFIFVFTNTAKTIYAAQSSRLGYHGFLRGLKSLSVLCSVLFLKAYMQSKALYQATLSRGYIGTFYRQLSERTLNVKRLIGICILESLLFVLGGIL